MLKKANYKASVLVVNYNNEEHLSQCIESILKQSYRNIEIILKEFDASLDNLIDETWFVTNMEECMNNVGEIFDLREEIFGCKPEVSQTLVEVSNLVDSKYKIEIKCIAYLED